MVSGSRASTRLMLGCNLMLGLRAMSAMAAASAGMPNAHPSSMKERRVTTNHAFTGRMCAASRYLETARPDAMFRDPLGYRLAGEEGRAHPMGSWIMVPRTVYGDELLTNRYRKQKVRQLVLLGAGMDARAWRMDLPELRVFEVDQQTTFDVKEPLVADEPLRVKSRKVVATDFSKSDANTNRAQWAEDLVQSGFDTNVPTVWLLEGLVMYLENHEMELVMRKIGQLTTAQAVGSAVFHDAISATYGQRRISVAGADFVGGSDDYAKDWFLHAGFHKSHIWDFDSILLDREKKRLRFDPQVPEATPNHCRGRNVVLFVEVEKV